MKPRNFPSMRTWILTVGVALIATSCGLPSLGAIIGQESQCNCAADVTARQFQSQNAAYHPTNYVDAEILVKLRAGSENALDELKGVPTNAVPSTSVVAVPKPSNELVTILRSYGARSARDAFRAANISPTRQLALANRSPTQRAALANARAGLLRWRRVLLTGTYDPEAVARAVRGQPDVEWAEPNYTRRPQGVPDATTDPSIGEQWHLINSRVQQTWTLLETSGFNPGGSKDVIVAVVDTGVDYNHEDLQGSMWVNSGEIPGNGIDDDGNGFVDDVHGANVVSNPDSHSGDPMDLHGHGTHVAGIIGAQAYNHLGGVGVAFNCQIMAVRAAQYSGTLAVADVAEGILYAIDNGADVINMSFGGYGRSQIEEDALALAFNQAVLVAAAGNDNKPTEFPGVCTPVAPMYPAVLPWVLGVMASTKTNTIAWFSNYDPCSNTRLEYEIAAPGESIYSTLPGNHTPSGVALPWRLRWYPGSRRCCDRFTSTATCTAHVLSWDRLPVVRLVRKGASRVSRRRSPTLPRRPRVIPLRV